VNETEFISSIKSFISPLFRQNLIIARYFCHLPVHIFCWSFLVRSLCQFPIHSIEFELAISSFQCFCSCTLMRPQYIQYYINLRSVEDIKSNMFKTGNFPCVCMLNKMKIGFRCVDNAVIVRCPETIQTREYSNHFFLMFFV
jgi:hypothetical protein